MTRNRRRALLLFPALLACAGILFWVLRPVPWEDASTPPPAFEEARAFLDAGELDRGARAMRRALRRYRAPHWEDRYRLLAARRLTDAERYEEAARILDDPPADDSPLAGHAALLRGRILLGLGDADEARRAASRAAAIAGFPGRDEAIRLEATALERQRRTEEALEVLDSSESWNLRLEASRLAARAGQGEEARRRLVRIVLDADEPASAERALDTLEEAVADPAARLRPEERPGLRETASRWIEENRPGPALRLLQSGRAPGAAPSDPREALLEAHALWRMGRSMEARGPAALARTGDAETREGARYVMARIDLSRGRVSAWRSALESLARLPGASTWKLRALRDLAMSGEGVPSAGTLARYRAYRVAAGERADPTAMLREFWAAWELRRFEDSDAALRRILSRDDMPSGVRAAALYWAGRRLEAQGRPDEARRGVFAELREKFPNHYYGGVLERHLGKAPPVPASDGSAPPRPDQCGEGAPWLEAARQLASVGLWSDAADAYRGAARLAPPPCARKVALEAMERAEAAAIASDALDFAGLAVGDLEACPPDAVPAGVWRVLLPVPSADLLVDAARRERLDPRFVAAVVRQESGFQPMAVSSAGARGLLQVMPAVGAEWARRLSVRDFRPDRLFEPELNLRLGTAYLRALVDRFPFRGAALAAYNAGPSRAQRWLLRGDEEDRFVERIPIPETRLYVKRILTLDRLHRIAWPDGLEDAGRRSGEGDGTLDGPERRNAP
jgi:soluble lytic murein transglycosylase